MQPKDFDDEVASSADRGQKRRRRQAHADKWKVLETPGAGLLLQRAAHAYVEETQPRSPVSITGAAVRVEYLPVFLFLLGPLNLLKRLNISCSSK